jgi:hypothetical protein
MSKDNFNIIVFVFLSFSISIPLLLFTLGCQRLSLDLEELLTAQKKERNAFLVIWGIFELLVMRGIKRCGASGTPPGLPDPDKLL